MAVIREGGLSDQRVIDLLHRHVTTARAATVAESAHALDLTGLQAPDISFWTAWEGDMPVAVGALRALSPDQGEVKSMHTAETARRRGFGEAMLGHIIATARARGYRSLSLETGSMAFFAPARALYRRHGFVDCAPFGDYRPDPNSCYLTLVLDDRRSVRDAGG